MSEPVGNSPRSMGDIPANSHKAREAKEAAKEVEAKEPIEKIIGGTATARKVPWYKRYARNIIADDATSIGDYIMTDIIIPAIRNLIGDAVKGSTDRILYGHSRGRDRGGLAERGTLRTRYDKMSEIEPRGRLSQSARARHDFDAIILGERQDAIDVVDALIGRVARYGAATVSDLYDYVGETGSYVDRNYGWTNLNGADVRQVRGGWLLDLPQPELLR